MEPDFQIGGREGDFEESIELEIIPGGGVFYMIGLKKIENCHGFDKNRLLRLIFTGEEEGGEFYHFPRFVIFRETGDFFVGW